MADARNYTSSRTGMKRRLRIWFLLVASFMGWAVYTSFQQLESRAETMRALDSLREKVAAAEQRQAELEFEIERLSDPEYIKELARKNGLAMPGEQPIQVTESGD
ncbi:MAG: septum formation initiator [Thermobacillus sp. ZCTH02-B1]|uniref:FtsB family cell division protein n=1 Tax=Thermobacillus sp. ZCTH02-B1 TaxID=1858795 RepID=UPI000B55E238|nr:septum formation initiator family protein [Thermobacillus sp. ZCTH02-B1]OUM95533.1 MAG: septum formation initiator [Thermobacillus sp. ZCTH02-B1]